MAHEDLGELERDVEAARARLAADLDVLRSPGTYSEVTDNLKAAAYETKDELIAAARSRTTSAVEEAIDNIKARAAANPAAVLLIGAGVAWHLLRRPPVVAALVGGGLYGLMRTQPLGYGHMDDRAYMEQAKSNLRRQGRDIAQKAGDVGMQTAEAARQEAAALADSAVKAGRQAVATTMHKTAELAEATGEAGRHAAEAMRSKAAEWTGRSSNHASGPRHELADGRFAGNGTGRHYAARHSNGDLSTDRLLLGAAGVAVAAALAFAWQRGSDDQGAAPR